MKLELLDESGSGGDKTIRNVILAAVGVSVAAVTGYGVYKLVRQYLENTPPKQ